HFLLHSDFEAVRQKGLVIESVNGDFVLSEVHAHADTRTMPPVDGVFVALKTTQNHRLPDLLKPLLGPQTAVITLQNGLDVETEMASWLGDRPLLGGLCFICSNKVGPGHIRHLEYGKIGLGQYAPDHQPAGISDVLKRLADDLEQAGILVEITPDLRLTRWRKLVWNIPFNGLSVVLNAMTDEIMDNSDALALVEELMAETIAACEGEMRGLSPDQTRRLPVDLIEQMIEHTLEMTPYRTSMKIDYDTGRSLELEAIFGNPIRAAKAAAVDVPRIEMLYQQLKFLNSQ
ncbi:2-dehydropantoate 2-reductase, partial [filamentous cyanobacterium CCP5]